MVSKKADELGIENKPDTPEVVENLRLLCTKVLQPLREHFGVIDISSGYRCQALTDAIYRAKGKTPPAVPSQHGKGMAADIQVRSTEVSNLALAQYIEANLPFDQLILENHKRGDPNSGWVHVSYSKFRERRDAKRAVFERGKPLQYIPGLVG